MGYGIWRSLVVLFSAGVSGGALLAGNIDIELSYDLFGHLSNDERGYCACTSLMNSFVYLKNAFPTIYVGTRLTSGSGDDYNGDGVVDTRDARDELGLTIGTGKNAQAIWEAKLGWVTTYAPGTTYFEGMVDENPIGWRSYQIPIKGTPTIDFLLEMIRRKQDIEIAFDLPGGAHAVTLTSVHIKDNNDNGKWDPALNEPASIDYIDPNRPQGPGATPGPTESAITLGADGYMHFSWWDGNPLTNPVDAKIFLAYAESPMPEPATYVMIATALLAFAMRSTRRASGCRRGA